jgi:guanine deaminase
MCLGAIYWARPSRVYYAGTSVDAAAAGFDDGFIYTEIQRAPDERIIPMMQNLQEDSREVFSAWLRSENKQPIRNNSRRCGT